MILDIYNDSIKYSIKNSKSLLYFGLTLFSTFIIWMAYILILIHYQDANLNLKFASLIVPSLLTLIPIFLFYLVVTVVTVISQKVGGGQISTV